MACLYFGGQLLIFITITITSQVEYRIVTEWNTISTKKAQSGPTVLTQKDTQSRESKKNVELLPKKTGLELGRWLNA